MIKKITIFPLILLLSMFLSAQNIDEIFNDNTEVYFTFNLDEAGRVNELSKMISVDKLTEGLQVFAYANRTGFTKFLEEGIEFEILQHPGTLIHPRMLDKVDIREIDAWDFYPTYDAYIDMMYQFEADFPEICEVIRIGYTYEEREILAMRITDNIGQYEGEPEFLYTSSIHGDETTGYVLMLRLIDYLLNGYGENPRITNM